MWFLIAVLFAYSLTKKNGDINGKDAELSNFKLTRKFYRFFLFFKDETRDSLSSQLALTGDGNKALRRVLYISEYIYIYVYIYKRVIGGSLFNVNEWGPQLGK